MSLLQRLRDYFAPPELVEYKSCIDPRAQVDGSAESIRRAAAAIRKHAQQEAAQFAGSEQSIGQRKRLRKAGR